MESTCVFTYCEAGDLVTRVSSIHPDCKVFGSLGKLGGEWRPTNELNKAHVEEKKAQMVSIGEKDILDGEKKLILGMIWSIIVWFMPKELRAKGGGKGGWWHGSLEEHGAGLGALSYGGHG